MSLPDPSTAIAKPPEAGTESDLASLLAEPAPRVWYRRSALWAGIKRAGSPVRHRFTLHIPWRAAT
jgi:hypothetical protein